MSGGGESTAMKKAREKRPGSEVDKSGGTGNNGPLKLNRRPARDGDQLHHGNPRNESEEG